MDEEAVLEALTAECKQDLHSSDGETMGWYVRGMYERFKAELEGTVREERPRVRAPNPMHSGGSHERSRRALPNGLHEHRSSVFCTAQSRELHSSPNATGASGLHILLGRLDIWPSTIQQLGSNRAATYASNLHSYHCGGRAALCEGCSRSRPPHSSHRIPAHLVRLLSRHGSDSSHHASRPTSRVRMRTHAQVYSLVYPFRSHSHYVELEAHPRTNELQVKTTSS
jgi:hypothetical protein